MILTALRIRNFRSLEDVSLDDLTAMNVVIGRNNSGKSATLGALQLLQSVVCGLSQDWSTAITHRDKSRRLELEMEFALTPDERSRFVTIAVSDEFHRQRYLDSPLAVGVRFRFHSQPGEAQLLMLQRTELSSAVGRWATIQRKSGPDQGNPESVFKTAEV